MSDEQCKEIVVQHEGLASYRHRCKMKAKKDGYCGIHHPDAVKARMAKSDKKWKEKMEKRHKQIQEPIDRAYRTGIERTLDWVNKNIYKINDKQRKQAIHELEKKHV